MKLTEITLKGFKSIDSTGQTVPFGDVTVLLGANNSGKSNLISFFKMLNFMTTEALQIYVAQQGSSRLLFYGSKKTEAISFVLRFTSEKIKNEHEAEDTYEETYEVKLSHGLPDRLIVSGEKVIFRKKGYSKSQEYDLKNGSDELGLKNDSRQTSKVLASILANIRVYQFHDTSQTAKIKDRGYMDDATYLRSDAGNLAAFLRMLKNHSDYALYYQRIVRHIQKIMPQFGDFILDSIPGSENYVRLNWTDRSGNDYLFDPHQISDGSLRFMALATLLLQPKILLPKFIVLDEPELGLHPAAIAELGGMIKTASKNAQILIATQSTRLVDEFTLDEIVIVERDPEGLGSQFRKFSTEELDDWLARYTLSELWEKNVLGGQP